MMLWSCTADDLDTMRRLMRPLQAASPLSTIGHGIASRVLAPLTVDDRGMGGIIVMDETEAKRLDLMRSLAIKLRETGMFDED